MNWFQKMWYFVVSSNDEPFLQEIKNLEDDKKELGVEIARVGDNYIESVKLTETLENQLNIKEDKILVLQEKLSHEEKQEALETYWNNKRNKVGNYEYPARPPLDGETNTDVDPTIFFHETDNNIPKISGDSFDDIASKALDYVYRKITYTTDPTQFKRNEAWLFSFETLKLRKGDCEDGAILMANIMLKSGIPYWRIRLNAGDVQGGGHCWVTYLSEKDNKWYILDWCYWYQDSKDLKQSWDDAKNYFRIWFSFNKKYIFKDATLDR